MTQWIAHRINANIVMFDDIFVTIQVYIIRDNVMMHMYNSHAHTEHSKTTAWLRNAKCSSMFSTAHIITALQ